MRHPVLLAVLSSLGGCGLLGGPPGPWVSTEGCMQMSEGGDSCPAADAVDPDDLYNPGWCDSEFKSVDGPGTREDDPWDDSGDDTALCCYPATGRNLSTNCKAGRPYREDQTERWAPCRPGGTWAAGADAVMDAPDRATRWLEAARAEHASIAAFARLTLDLLALGAPPDLLAAVQDAARDEVDHAARCFRLAARFGAGVQQPGPFPFTQPISPCTNPADVAAAAVRDGCLAETVSAWQAAEAARVATDPEERAALQAIAADETRHAALSWRIVAWLLKSGDTAVSDAVDAAFAAPFAVDPPAFPHEGASLDDATACARVVREVLSPAREALHAVQ